MSSKKKPPEGLDLPSTAEENGGQRRLVGQLDEQEPVGLVAVGVVMRRKKRTVGENDTEVVTYTLGPKMVDVDVWEPTAYWSVGTVVRLEVEWNIYNGRVTFRQCRVEEVF